MNFIIDHKYGYTSRYKRVLKSTFTMAANINMNKKIGVLLTTSEVNIYVTAELFIYSAI